MEGNKYLDLVKQWIPGWHNIQHATIQTLAGISNKVYLMSNQDNANPTSVIVREYGPEIVTNKAREQVIFEALAAEGLAPKVFGGSETVRVEEYLEGYLPLARAVCSDPGIVTLIVSEVRRLHSVPLIVPELICVEHPQQWRRLCLERFRTDPDVDPPDVRKYVLEDVYWERYLELLPSDTPLVNSHMDLSTMNLLYNETEHRVRMIDFEFAGAAYRAMDLAIFLNDLPHDYAFKDPPYWKFHEEYTATDQLIWEYAKAYGEPRTLWVELKLCYIAACYIWGLWSLAMVGKTDSEYGYLSYALKRFRDFDERYTEYSRRGGTHYLREQAEQFE